MSHPHQAHTDPATTCFPPEEVHASPHYVMYSVFRTAVPLTSPDTEAAEEAVLETGVTIRGWYDIGGFRADADLMLWALAEDARPLQAAYHALRRSELGQSLDPVWSCIGCIASRVQPRPHTRLFLGCRTPALGMCLPLRAQLRLVLHGRRAPLQDAG